MCRHEVAKTARGEGGEGKAETRKKLRTVEECGETFATLLE
jgi:hypothetical protein